MHKQLRLFIPLPSRNPTKRKEPPTAQPNAEWTSQDGGHHTTFPVNIQNDLLVAGNVHVHGNITATGAIQRLSDATTKENIKPRNPEQSLQNVMNIPIYNYNYKKEFSDPTKQFIGPMAQEIEKNIPTAVSELGGKKLITPDDMVFETMNALKALYQKYLTICACIANNEVGTSDKFAAILQQIRADLLANPDFAAYIPASSESGLEDLKKEGLIKHDEEKPRLDLAKSVPIVNSLLLHVLGEADNKADAKLGIPDKLKRAEELMKRLQERRKKVAESWSLRCKDCEEVLCSLNTLHFYQSYEQNEYFLVCDKPVEEWVGKVNTKKMPEELYKSAKLECAECGMVVGYVSKHRGKGSPKPEIDVTKVEFINLENNTTKKFATVSAVYDSFTGSIDLQKATEDDHLAETKEERERKIANMPTSIKIKVRPIPQPGVKQNGILWTCKKEETVAQLMDRIKKRFPESSIDALFMNEDQLDMLDEAELVCEILHDNDPVYYGKKPTNEVILELREYQAELLEEAEKSNRAVVCPTGSGKTAIAVETDRRLRQKNHDLKTVMVVRDVPLSVQQCNYFRKNSAKLRVTLINSDHPLTQEWEEMLESCDVVVLTAQVLLNNLTAGKAHISKIGLLILDEAHNTAKNHPFNVIMREYYHKAEGKRPRVLALTASPPAHISVQRTKELIEMFENNTNCKVLLVNEYKQKLIESISIPRTTVYSIQPSQIEKQFLALVEAACNQLERNGVHAQSEAGEGDIARDSKEYQDWLYTKKPSQYQQLLTFNEALMTFNDLGLPSAVEILQEKAEEFESVKKVLEGLGAVHDQEKVKEKIFLDKLQEFKDVKDFRGIVFVGTKKGGAEIAKAIQESNMPYIKPHLFFGHQDKNGNGMSSSSQQKALEKFKKGEEVNLLIATSVAEEGLDITACNVVFRYDSVFSHKSLIQTRGRARQKNSQFIIFYHINSQAERAWLSSEKKLKNMLLAVGESTKVGVSPFISETRYLTAKGETIVPPNLFPDEDGTKKDVKEDTKEDGEEEKEDEEKEEEEKEEEEEEESEEESEESEESEDEEEDEEEEETEDEEEEEEKVEATPVVIEDEEEEAEIPLKTPKSRQQKPVPSAEPKQYPAQSPEPKPKAAPPSPLSPSPSPAPSVSSPPQRSRSPPSESTPKKTSAISSTPTSPSVTPLSPPAPATPTTPSTPSPSSNPSTPSSSNPSTPSSTPPTPTEKHPIVELREAYQKKYKAALPKGLAQERRKTPDPLWEVSLEINTTSGRKTFTGQGRKKLEAENDMALKILACISEWAEKQ